jgi:hypothetical protein
MRAPRRALGAVAMAAIALAVPAAPAASPAATSCGFASGTLSVDSNALLEGDPDESDERPDDGGRDVPG